MPIHLQRYVEQQVNTFFQYEMDVGDCVKNAFARTASCLSHSSNKYDKRENAISVYNSTQYCLFLYNLSRQLFEVDGNGERAEKVYLLNKLLNSVDLFYEIELPTIWSCEHPLGSVMGRAHYSDYFYFYQGCTVGGNTRMLNPVIGEHVIMFSNSKVLGNSEIGDYVLLAANAYVKDEIIPCNSIVFGESPNLIIKQKNREEIAQTISTIWRD